MRPFQSADVAACLSVFDSNVPTYFGAHERADFARYLQQPEQLANYFVLEDTGRLVACGGLAFDQDGTATFCWGMVDRAFHRKGLGRALALARLAQARAMGAHRVVLSTSQHTQAFYATLGFTVTGVVVEGHGPGLDAVDMALGLLIQDRRPVGP